MLRYNINKYIFTKKKEKNFRSKVYCNLNVIPNYDNRFEILGSNNDLKFYLEQSLLVNLAEILLTGETESLKNLNL